MVCSGQGRKSDSLDRGVLGKAEMENGLHHRWLLESLSPVNVYDMTFDLFHSGEPEDHLGHEFLFVRRSVGLLSIVNVKSFGGFRVTIVGGSDFGDRRDIVE